MRTRIVSSIADTERIVTASETMRMQRAIQLAKDVEVCASLLKGELVDEAALDRDWLELAKQLRVIGIRDTTRKPFSSRRKWQQKTPRERGF